MSRKKMILVVCTVLALNVWACGDNTADMKDAEALNPEMATTEVLTTEAVTTEAATATTATTATVTTEIVSEVMTSATTTAATSVESSTEEGEDTVVTLQNVLATHNMKAGTCLSDYMITDAKCVEFIKENFNSITFENLLKPDYILNQKASQAKGDIVAEFNSATESLLKWCADNGMSLRGHTLIWHSQTPNWIFHEAFDTNKPLVGRDVMLARMESYISQVFKLLEDKGYIKLFYAYDVVNEAWEDNGTRRNSLWLNTIGEDYLWYAFYYADKYAPDYIDLYYNDYNEQYKTDTLSAFVKTLVDKDGRYLIDGIGLQGHLYTGDNVRNYLSAVEKYGSTGLKVCITELDVGLGAYKAVKQPTEENLKLQGRYYYNLINGILKLVDEGKVKMDSLTWWGFSDGLSWRNDCSPLLLDKDYNPKYAYYAALQVKEQAGFDK